jgi:hypothetical protein
MDEKQNTDLARSLDQIISLLRGILIAPWAIVGLLGFRH